MSIERDEIGDMDPEKLLAAGLPDEEEGGIEPERLAHAFPNLEILEMLGRGGMGVVYRARQRQLDREVAVKILPPGIGDDAAFPERFAREAKALAKLDHPGIVRVHEAGEADGLFFFVMEYVDGVNLREAMRGGVLEPAEALRIVPQVCDALQYAHDHGIVHRDVKPENILLARGGQVKIADFGLAKLVGDRPVDASLTGVEQVMGTFHYIAPEQIRTPKDVDHRADVYSLGVVFYEMLTGELPIGRFPAPSERVSVDVRLDTVVLRTLERERERRYQRVDDVKTGVAAATSSAVSPPAPKPEVPGPGATTPPEPRLSALAVAGILGVPIALVIGLLVLAFGARDEHAILVGTAVAILGVAVSMIAHFSIRRSGGRLTGDKLAKAGITLPPLLGVVLLAATLAIYYGFLGPQMSREAEKAEREAEKQILETRVEWCFTELAMLGPAVTPADLAVLVAPSIMRELESVGPEEFLATHGEEAGLAFFDLAKWPGPLRGFDYRGAKLDGDRAVVTLNHPDGMLRFPMVREDGEWYFGLGKVEVGTR